MEKDNRELPSSKDMHMLSQETDYVIGQDNIQIYGLDVHNPVFAMSAALVLIFSSLALAFPETSTSILVESRDLILDLFDTLFSLSIIALTCFILFLIISPFGRIRIGGENAKTEFKFISWVCMLFSAGVGIGMTFYGAAEPLAYFTGIYGTPLGVTAETPEAYRLAFSATLFHWGISGWSVYALIGLSIGFFTFNRGLPLTIRSIFYPLLGERVWGWPGHIIDILAVLATLFGLATSLGLGAQQASAGINHVFGTDGGVGAQLLVIIGVTLLAIISVVRGIDGGVKVLSNINMLIAFALLLFVGLVGFAVAIGNVPNTVMGYVENIIPLSNPHGREDETWMHGWTVFYWAWWISWSPFVGMFIARVSRGRTIREFLIAVLLIPTAVTILWMSIYGGIAIDQVVQGVGSLGVNGLTDVPMAMFQMLDELPMSSVLSFLAVVLVLVFFITSSDSGSLVIDSITAGGKVDAPVPQRIFWATVEGSIAAALLWI